MKKTQSRQGTNNQLTRKIFVISGMDCVACALTIDGDLEEKEGIKMAKTNYAKSQVEVEFNDAKISEKEILAVIKKAGYTALPL